MQRVDSYRSTGKQPRGDHPLVFQIYRSGVISHAPFPILDAGSRPPVPGQGESERVQAFAGVLDSLRLERPLWLVASASPGRVAEGGRGKQGKHQHFRFCGRRAA